MAGETISTRARLLAPLERPGDPLMPKSIVVADGTDLRFSLTYLWDEAEPILPWIMLNPALAGTQTFFDLTARRVIRFSHRWGFGGAQLLNIVPKITPHPKELRAWLAFPARRDWEVRDQLWRNWSILQQELAVHDAAMVAWGSSHAAWRGQGAYDFDVMLEQAFDTINDPEGPRTKTLQLFCLGRTGGGAPLHPMARGRHRVPDTARPVPFPDQPGTYRLGEAA